MNRICLLLSVTTILLVGATFRLLVRVRDRQTLGVPAVRITSVPLISSDGRIVRTNSVFLPTRVSGYDARAGSMTDQELSYLPPDTTFGRQIYRSLIDNNFAVQTSVVLMGRDRTSIHQPDFCLTGAGWMIQSKRHETIPLPGTPLRILPVRRFDAQLNYAAPDGTPRRISGVYVFWFAADGEATSNQFQRTWSLLRHLVTEGMLQRWSYISYFAQCEPGQEDATYARLRDLIMETVPQFQRFELASSK